MRTEPRFDLRYDPSDDVSEMDRYIMGYANEIVAYLVDHQTEFPIYIEACRDAMQSNLTWGEIFAAHPGAKREELALSDQFGTGHSGSSWTLTRSRVAHLLFKHEPGEPNIQVIS